MINNLSLKKGGRPGTAHIRGPTGGGGTGGEGRLVFMMASHGTVVALRHTGNAVRLVLSK